MRPPLLLPLLLLLLLLLLHEQERVQIGTRVRSLLREEAGALRRLRRLRE